MFALLSLLAEGSSAGSESPSSPFGNPLLLLLPIGVLFYLMLMRGPKRQEQERQAMLANLKKNDRVITTSGIYATVVAVADKEDEVTVKVDDNVRMKVTKGSIARNLSREEESKAAKEKKNTKEPQKEGGA